MSELRPAVRERLGEEKFEATGGGPNCPQCDGLIKPATVSFGQAMPEAEMKRAEEAALSRDPFIAMGSSLAVFQAAGFAVLARRNGARLVIVNREPTDIDGMADLVVNGEIGDVMGPFLQLN